MVKPIFKLVSGVKDLDCCKKIDPLRLRKYTRCYISQNRNLPIDDFVRNAKAPVEHLFNDHQWCNASWCWAKDLDNKTHKMYTHLMSKKVSLLKQSFK